MSYRIQLELIFNTRTAFFISEYKINLAEAAINGILKEIEREHDVRHIIQVETPQDKIDALSQALKRMRERADLLQEELKKVQPVGFMQRARGWS